MRKFNNNGIIITGATGGIGQALITASKENGFYPFSFSRRHNVSVTDGVSIRNAIDRFDDRCIPDILINNAGVICTGGLQTPKCELQRSMNVNFFGAVHTTQAFVDRRNWAKQKGGIIINIASTAGLAPRPTRMAYAASKAALISFSLSLSEELKDYKVYCIAPGAVNTRMRDVIAPDETPEERRQMLQPKDVANYIMQLIMFENKEHGKVLEFRGESRNELTNT